MAGGFPISGVESSLFNLHPPPALSPGLAFLGSMPGLLFRQAEPKEMFCEQRLQVTLSRPELAHCRVPGQPPAAAWCDMRPPRTALSATQQPAPGRLQAATGPLAAVLSPPSPAPIWGLLPHRPQATSIGDGRTRGANDDKQH